MSSRPLGPPAVVSRLVDPATGLGKLTIEEVSGLVDPSELRSRTFDSMAAARRWVSEAPAS
ncbi:MAG: hypothetical protein ACYDA0_05335 [Candidatus Dormibacteraceae bacterium]